jgi:hypothetical protein
VEPESGPKATAIDEPNYIVKLFRGDVPLPITYWIFGVVFSLLLHIPRRVIESDYLDIIRLPLGAQLIVAYSWLVIGYGFFIAIAIWRSAGKFEGHRFWALLARVIVVFNVIAMVNNIYTGTGDRVDKKTRMAEEIRLINKSLPRMIDDDMRLDRISIFERSMRYNYTLVNVRAVDIDIDRLLIAQVPIVKLSTCENKDMRAILEDDMDLTFAYYDKMSNPVITITVTKQDCR